MRIIIVAGLVLSTLALRVSAAPVDITIRARSDQTPVKSGIFSKDPTKSDWWFRDTSDDGDAKLTNYSCADGQVFQARPKRPGYIFDPQDWKICEAGILPFAFKKVLYSAELQKALSTVGRLQSTDDQIALIREIFLKAYDSGDFFALSASSSELEKKLADQKDVSQSLNIMTLESLQRGLGSDKPLNFDPQTDIPRVTPKPAWRVAILQRPWKPDGRYGWLPAARAARTMVEGLIWLFSLASGRIPPVDCA